MIVLWFFKGKIIMRSSSLLEPSPMTCKAAPIQDFVRLVTEAVQPTVVLYRLGPLVAYMCPIFWTAGFPMTFLATFIIFKIVGVINYFGYQTVDAIVSVHGTFIHRLHQRVWINPRIIQLVGELAPKSPVELARSSSQ